MKNETVTQAQQIASLWWEMWDEQTARTTQHVQSAIEESARLAKDAITYQQKVAAEWRKIILGSNNSAS